MWRPMENGQNATSESASKRANGTSRSARRSDSRPTEHARRPMNDTNRNETAGTRFAEIANRADPSSQILGV